MSGRATIPVKEMALDILENVLPQCTPEEIAALKTGKRPPRWTPEANEESKAPAPPAPLGDSSAPIITGSQFPLVTCILVFGGPEERLKLPRKAVNQFVAQSYPSKQLVIVNGSGHPITNRAHPLIKERTCSPGLTIGAMRNVGLDLADGDWIMPCWDDDDLYDIHRLMYQMAFIQPGKAALLTHQVRFDVHRSTVYIHHQPEGIPNTMIVPRTQPEQRFPDTSAGDATAFWMEHFGIRTVAIDNSQFGANMVSMAAYHGHNATTREEFMVGHTDDEFENRWEVAEFEAEHIRAVLLGTGLEAKPRKAEPEEALLPT